MHFQGDNTLLYLFIYFKYIFNSLVESIFIRNYGCVISVQTALNVIATLHVPMIFIRALKSHVLFIS